MTNETPKFFYLYRITNLLNNKIYIGQSVNPRSRWYQHKNDASKSGPPMVITKAIKKYGNENFEFEVIATCKNQNDANDLETFLVEQYESHISTGMGYNVSFGGMNAPKSEAWIQQMRDHWADPKYKNRVGAAISQATLSRTPEEKAAISKILSESQKGNHNSPETEFKKGHQPSPETIKKVSDKLTGVPRPERQGIDPLSKEQRERLNEINRGRAPWNKNTKGICKPNSGSFITKINWPTDQELLKLVNDNGMTAVGKIIGACVSSVSQRVSKIRNQI